MAEFGGPPGLPESWQSCAVQCPATTSAKAGFLGSTMPRTSVRSTGGRFPTDSRISGAGRTSSVRPLPSLQPIDGRGGD